jgi:Arc/MetJ-type ribon-helix-helix transcriptional regulator
MTRSAIPDPRDESLRDRETVRLPRSMTADIDELVDEGK